MAVGVAAEHPDLATQLLTPLPPDAEEEAATDSTSLSYTVEAADASVCPSSIVFICIVASDASSVRRTDRLPCSSC